MNDPATAIMTAQVALAVAAGSFASTVIVAVLGFEFRRRFERKLQEEKYSFEKNAVKFTEIFKKVSSTTDEAFGKVTAIYLRCWELIADLGLDNVERKNAQARELWVQMNELVTFIALNRLYLPKAVHLEMNAFLDTLRKVYFPMKQYLVDVIRDEPMTKNSWADAESMYKTKAMPAYEKLCDGVQQYLELAALPPPPKYWLRRVSGF
jgi:hypothetical protein